MMVLILTGSLPRGISGKVRAKRCQLLSSARKIGRLASGTALTQQIVRLHYEMN
jgi:hypothetical protein